MTIALNENIGGIGVLEYLAWANLDKVVRDGSLNRGPYDVREGILTRCEGLASLCSELWA